MSSPPTKNWLLRALPAQTRDAVIAACERVDLAGGAILARLGDTTPAVHFPETAVISALATYEDGGTIEMANIGREASTGFGLTLGQPRQLDTTEVQIGGVALEMPAARFVELKGALPAFERLLFVSAQALFHQVMVSAACNGAHDSKQRLARWLLTMRDRTDGPTLPLTHAFLAEILGLRRATVTNAASELQRAGAIDYARGRIAITDRAALRAASCECYDLVRRANESLLPESPEGG